jgi:hypothetical protein
VEFSTTPRSLVDRQVHRSGGTTITDEKHRMVASGVPGELAAFGIPERTLGGR